MIKFMERTIAAHWLQCINLDFAAHLVPGRESNYFEAKRLAEETSYFERRNLLVPDDNFSCPPISSYIKSFKKWLALQKHDVRAVNSLYEWKKAIEMKQDELHDEVSVIEAQKAKMPLLGEYFDVLLKRKEARDRQMIQFKYDLDLKIEEIRRGKIRRENAA